MDAPSFSEQVVLATIGAVAASAASVLAFVRWLLPWAASRKQSDVADGLRRLSQTYRAMSDMRECGAQRVILWAAHNGGGVPRVGSPFYASAIHANVDRKFKHIVQEYQQVSVDADYIEMLLGIYANGRHRFITEQSEPCLLRDLYKAEGVVDSALYYIGIRENQFLYLSVAKYDGLFNAGELARIGVHADGIRHFLGKKG